MSVTIGPLSVGHITLMVIHINFCSNPCMLWPAMTVPLNILLQMM